MNDDWAGIDVDHYRETSSLRKNIDELDRIAKSAVKYIDSLGGDHLRNALIIEHIEWWETIKKREQAELEYQEWKKRRDEVEKVKDKKREELLNSMSEEERKLFS